MIASEYGFYNENDYSESDREMIVVICLYEKVAEMRKQMRTRLIYRELTRFITD